MVPKPLIPNSALVSNNRIEDEVTSVRSSAPVTQGSDRVVFSDPSFRHVDREDVIVDHTSVSPRAVSPDSSSAATRSLTDDDGLNAPAQEDQRERARAMAQGSRDAIIRARERHARNRRGTNRLHAPLRDVTDRVQPEPESPSPTEHEQDQVRASDAHADSSDADTGVPYDRSDHGVRRFGRHVQIRDDSSRQSTSIEFTRTPHDVAPTTSSPDPMHLVSRNVDRERFETVPEIKPTIELPRIRQFLQPGDAGPAAQEPAPAIQGQAPSVNSYDLVLRRAQAIKNASKTEGGGRPSRAMIPLPQPRSSAAATPGTARSLRPERVSPLPSITWEHEPEPVEAPYSGSHLPDIGGEPVVSGRQAIADPANDPDRFDTFDADELNDVWSESDEGDDGNDEAIAYVANESKSEHSRSWWRGLGINRSRRHTDAGVHVSDAGASWEMDDEDAYESALVAEEIAEDVYDDNWEDEPVFSPSRVTAPAPARARARGTTSHAGPAGSINPSRQGRANGDALPDAGVSRVRVATARATSRAIADSPDDDTGRIDAFSRESSVSSGVVREPARQSSRTLLTARADVPVPAREPSRIRWSRLDDCTPEDHDADVLHGAMLEPAIQGHSAAVATRRTRTAHSGTALERRTERPSPSREPQQASYQPLEEEPWEPGHSIVDTPTANESDVELAPEFDIRRFVTQQDDLLDMTISLAPDLPRTCQTCRDFRPSESGERGWCTNDWAFTHRQMVNADSLPCQSSIGCWWLPNDASWMPALAPPDHRRATPRTDRLVASARSDSTDTATTSHELYVREI